MATKVQRATLWHMIDNGGKALIFTGQKSTEWGHNSKCGAVVCGSMCLLFGLTANKWIEKDGNPEFSQYANQSFKITGKGIAAAGKYRPVMKAVSHGAHGIRWG